MTIATLAFAAISGAAANPASLPMGIEIIERDGVTLVREVVRYTAFLYHRNQWPQLTIPIDRHTSTLVWTCDAGSAFILAAAAQLAMAAAMLMSTEAALGVEITANPSAFRMARPARSGVSKHIGMKMNPPE